MSTVNLTSVYVSRPERFLALDLFPEPIPEFFINNRSCDVKNISANGIGCIFPESDPSRCQEGSDIEFCVKQSGYELYSGKGVIKRTNLVPTGHFAGISLANDDFCLADVRLANARVLFGLDENLPAYENVPDRYKMLCGDFLNFVTSQLTVIADRVAGQASPLSEDVKNKIATDMHEETKDEWLTFIERLNGCVLEYRMDAQTKLAVKKYTEHLITPLLNEGECWRRSYTKPLGYPGDYQIMNYAYDFDPLGDSVRAKYLHLMGVTSGRLILSRMKTLVDKIVNHASKRRNSNEYRIISIGSGPAREIEQLSHNLYKEHGLNLNATLVDSEPEAIDYSQTRLTNVDLLGFFRFKTVNVGIREIVSEKYDKAIYDDVDVIYSSGLFDYLGARTAKRYVEKLYDALKPGGCVIIGNVNAKPTGAIWVMEYATDWGLYFRNKDEMLAMAQGVKEAIVTVEEDEHKSVYFLTLEKPVLSVV